MDGTQLSRMQRVVVVGGGPAGMLAAISAAEAGARVILLERGPKTARKLRLTGKGRCNLTNSADVHAFVRAFEPNGRFLYGAFSRFFRDELLALLAGRGVATKVERGGRVFPESDSAQRVAAALEGLMAERGVDVRLNVRARSLWMADDRLAGIELFHGTMDAGAVIVATGGLSYPGTGSTGDGYALAAQAGHVVVPPRPALAPLRVAESWVRDLSGLALKNVEVRLFPAAHRRPIASEFGEMLFTHTGLSGPIVLTLSRRASVAAQDGSLFVEIDLKPALSDEQLDARFVRDFARTSHFRNYARELVPGSLAESLPMLADIPAQKPLHRITAAERARLVVAVKRLRFTITGLAPVEEAIVTAGGVSLQEVDPRTMMSRLVPGLFFAGEVLDLDAETGGYNLQAAFSTGWVAGRAAAQVVGSAGRTSTDGS